MARAAAPREAATAAPRARRRVDASSRRRSFSFCFTHARANARQRAARATRVDHDFAMLGRVDAPGGIHRVVVGRASASQPRTSDMIALSFSFFAFHARTNRLSSSACKYGTITARANSFASFASRRSRLPTPI
jgi:hypothetical protein